MVVFFWLKYMKRDRKQLDKQPKKHKLIYIYNTIILWSFRQDYLLLLTFLKYRYHKNFTDFNHLIISGGYILPRLYNSHFFSLVKIVCYQYSLILHLSIYPREGTTLLLTPPKHYSKNFTDFNNLISAGYILPRLYNHFSQKLFAATS